MRTPITLAALALTLSACGSPADSAQPVGSPSASSPASIDQAWKRDVQSIYGHPIRWNDYRMEFLGKDGECSKDEHDLETFLAVGQDLDGKWGQDFNTDLAAMRVSFRYACPDRSPMIDTALQAIKNAMVAAPVTDCGPLPKKKPAEFALICQRLHQIG